MRDCQMQKRPARKGRAPESPSKPLTAYVSQGILISSVATPNCGVHRLLRKSVFQRRTQKNIPRYERKGMVSCQRICVF